MNDSRPALMAKYEAEVTQRVNALIAAGALDEGNAQALDAYLDQILEVELGRMRAAHQRDLETKRQELAELDTKLAVARFAADEARAARDSAQLQLADAQRMLLGEERVSA
jgi:dsRNA-specific ribonuclease